jgi:hypothetical protein
MHRGPLALDGARRICEKLILNKTKRFSHHRGKGEFIQNAEAQFSNESAQNLLLVSEQSLGAAFRENSIFRRRRQTRLMSVIGVE